MYDLIKIKTSWALILYLMQYKIEFQEAVLTCTAAAAKAR